MKLKRHYSFVFIFVLISILRFGYAQPLLSGRDSALIIIKSEEVIQHSLQNLLNELSDSSYEDHERTALINRSFFSGSINLSRPVFESKNAIIENDLNPDEIAQSVKPADKTAIDYLFNFTQLYLKGSDQSVLIDRTICTEIKPGGSEMGDTVYAIVQFDIQFKRTNIVGSSYPMIAKSATVKLFNQNGKRRAIISGINFNSKAYASSSLFDLWYNSLNGKIIPEPFALMPADQNRLHEMLVIASEADSLYKAPERTTDRLDIIRDKFKSALALDPGNTFFKKRISNLDILIRQKLNIGEQRDSLQAIANKARIERRYKDERNAYVVLNTVFRTPHYASLVEQVDRKMTAVETISRTLKEEQFSEALKLASAQLSGNQSQDFEFLFLKASANYHLGNNPQALDDINRAIQLNEKPNDFYLLRGNILFNQKQVEGALIDFLKIHDADSKNKIIAERLGDCYVSIRNTEKAIQFYQKALALDEKNASVYIKLGNLYFEERKYANAAEQYRMAVLYKKNDVNLLYRTALAYHLSSDTKALVAAGYFKEVLQIQASDSLAQQAIGFEKSYYARALSRQEQSDYNNAILLFRASVLINNQNDSAYYRLGEIHMLLKKYNEAKNYLDTCLLLNNQFVKALTARGRVHFILGNYESSGNDFLAANNTAGRKDKGLAIEIYNGAGNAYSALNRLAEANEFYTKSIELDKTQSDIWLNAGINDYKGLQYKNALKNFTSATDANNHNAVAWFWRGKANIKLEKYSDAKKDFGVTQRTRANYPDLFLEWGNCYAAEGDFQNAVVQYNTEIQINYKNAEAYFKLAEAFFYLNDYVAAVRSFQDGMKYNDSLLLFNETRVALYAIASIYINETEFAYTTIQNGLTLYPKSSMIHFARACYFASKNDLANTVAELDLAIQYGKITKAQLKEKVFDSIRKSKEFKAAADKL